MKYLFKLDIEKDKKLLFDAIGIYFLWYKLYYIEFYQACRPDCKLTKFVKLMHKKTDSSFPHTVHIHCILHYIQYMSYRSNLACVNYPKNLKLVKAEDVAYKICVEVKQTDYVTIGRLLS